MRTKCTVLLAIVVLLAAIAPARVTWSAAPAQLDLPEQEGIYSVPGRPELKLRVFVHKPRVENHGKPQNAGKPTPPPPTLVCNATAVVDPDSSAVVHGAGWTLPGSWEYHLNPGSVPSTVGTSSLATIADNAFDTWSGAINNAVNITRGADTTVTRSQLDGQNIVSWGRTSGTALATSYVWYNSLSGVLVEVDTIMNKKFTWYWSDPSTWPQGQTCAFAGVYDAQDLLAHELGHTMGLDDEYDAAYVNNTMYGFGTTGETKKDTLATGDAAGAAALY